MKSIRIGIDVGGTFTHAVAIDNETMKIVDKVKVFTTHNAVEGVARGIIDSLNKLLTEGHIVTEEVVFIAHSTTQATNALLEGDVAKVGIIGMGSGLEAFKARQDTVINEITLAPGKSIAICHCFLNTSDRLTEEVVQHTIEELRKLKAEVIVASEAFSVDNSQNEKMVLSVAEQMGLSGTCSHEISKLYGLKVRTATAVINASILPKMINTANTTELSVKNAGIAAPLMIMRGDGGAMTIQDMRRRPILTMLSGPAAGVAGALMYEKVSYGIFLEVGGTSTDMSAIKNGKVMVEYAEVGGHKTYLRSLDTRTIGLAGGSMIVIEGNSLVDVGPRSAHIAGLPYAVFAEDDIENPKLFFVSPKPGDPQYVGIEAKDGKRYALTLTCVANALGITKAGDTAYGDPEKARRALQPLAELIGLSVKDTATKVMDIAANKVIRVVKTLWSKYEMDPESLVLVGGGGGCTAIVPYVADKLSLRHKIAANADVISSIGVALAMVRDVVERSIINPGSEDILKIRKEAETSVIKMGADPASVEVFVEIESKKNIVRATGIGALALRNKNEFIKVLSQDELIKCAAKSMTVPAENVETAGTTHSLFVFITEKVERKLWGLMKTITHPIRVLDQEGVIRFSNPNAKVMNYQARELIGKLPEFMKKSSQYGDGGEGVPDIFIIEGGKIIDLTGLEDVEQIQALIKVEIAGLKEDDTIIALAGLKRV